MFGGKKDKKEETNTSSYSNRNIIDRGTKIVGDINSEGDFRIDGTLEGTLITKGRIIIGKEGSVKGKMECGNADIEGTFSGDLVVNNTLTAKSTANITGNVTFSQISTEPGATFNVDNMKTKASTPNNDTKNSKDSKDSKTK